MFLPGRSVEQENIDRKKHYKRVVDLMQETFESKEIRDACTVTVQEVQCGDPNCAPIDTIVSLTFDK